MRRAGIEQNLALGQLIHDLRTEAGLSQSALAERMGTTQSVDFASRRGWGSEDRLDTLARVATALERHLVVSFPEKGSRSPEGSGSLMSVADARSRPVYKRA